MKGKLESCYLWPLEVEYATRLVGSQGRRAGARRTNRRLGVNRGTRVRNREMVTVSIDGPYGYPALVGERV